MLTRLICLSVLCLSISSHALELRIEEVSIHLSSSWRVHQQALDKETRLIGFENGGGYLQLYVRPLRNRATPMIEMTDVKIVNEYMSSTDSFLRWNIKEIQKVDKSTMVASGSSTQFEYAIVSSGLTKENSLRYLKEFMSGVRELNASTRSLTGPDYTGKKYYVGFGDYLSGYMGNEVQYDIAHTHDVFTHEIGGSYIGTKIHGSEVDESELFKKWDELKSVMSEKDMYVQYSSGHGSHTGLMFGPSYNEIRDNALSYPAKEIIIFTMACYSGNLVNSFNQKKTVWQDWQSQGRTLFVMSSSKPDETSSTGPIHDEEEPNGPSGSAGSAFGHALWKALIGHADGEVDGIKDHFLSLEEIRDFTIKTTQNVGDHTPTVTGAYNGKLLMVKVPSKEYLSQFTGGTESLSDEAVLRRIHELDAQWRIK